MSKLCKQCATRPEDWEQDRFAFVAHSVRCSGCEVLEMEREQIPQKEKGVYVTLLPREVAEQMNLERGDGLMGEEDSVPEEGGLL